MVSYLEKAIQTLHRIGVVDVVLPFLLAFALVFALLQKSKVFRDKGKNPKTNIHAIIAFAMGMLFVNYVKAEPLIAYLSYFIVLFVIAIAVLILTSIFGINLGITRKLLMTVITAFFIIVVSINANLFIIIKFALIACVIITLFFGFWGVHPAILGTPYFIIFIITILGVFFDYAHIVEQTLVKVVPITVLIFSWCVWYIMHGPKEAEEEEPKKKEEKKKPKTEKDRDIEKIKKDMEKLSGKKLPAKAEKELHDATREEIQRLRKELERGLESIKAQGGESHGQREIDKGFDETKEVFNPEHEEGWD